MIRFFYLRIGGGAAVSLHCLQNSLPTRSLPLLNELLSFTISSPFQRSSKSL